MSSKKVVNWIKYNNIKNNSSNYTALKGMRRINKTISFFLKIGIPFSILTTGMIAFYYDFDYITKQGVYDFNKKLNSLQNVEKIFLNAHKKLMLDYTDLKVSIKK
jgi:hypothetical protein